MKRTVLAWLAMLALLLPVPAWAEARSVGVTAYYLDGSMYAYALLPELSEEQ